MASFGFSITSSLILIVSLGIALSLVYLFTKNRIKTNAAVLESNHQEQVTSSGLAQYLQVVVEDSNKLQFGDLVSASSESNPENDAINLSDIWTPLKVSVEPNEYGTDLANKDEEYFFEEFLDSTIRAKGNPENNRVLLIGEPGRGKSTSMALICLNHAKQILNSNCEIDENAISRIPVLVKLDQVVFTGTNYGDLITHCNQIRETKDASALITELENSASNGDVIFLFDGLDEVASHFQSHAVKFIYDAINKFPDSTFVVTCRSEEYAHSPDLHKFDSFHLCVLLPFTISDIRKYLLKWYRALSTRRNFSLSQCVKAANSLADAIKSDDSILRVAETPLLCALIASIHANRGELPRSRSLIYHESIRLLLADTPIWRNKIGGQQPVGRDLMRLVVDIAYTIHTNRAAENGGGELSLSDKSLMELVSKFAIRSQVEESTENASDLEKNKLDYFEKIVKGNSLFIQKQPNTYAFSHRAFQEFLVSQYFASGARTDIILRHSHDSRWAEPMRLLANYASVESSNIHYVLLLCETILDERTDIRSHCIVGEMLCEISIERLSDEGWQVVVESENEESDKQFLALWHKVRRKVLEHATSPTNPIPFDLKHRLFIALSGLGDTRIVDTKGNPYSPVRNLIDFKTTSIMAGHKPESEYLLTRVNKANALPSEPIRNVRVNEFSMGKYLVTNLEYAKFIQADGYKKYQYWKSESARLWLQNDPSFHSSLIDGWISTAERDYSSEFTDGHLSLSELRVTAKNILRSRIVPFYWDNRRFRTPNAPVVGVNLWEADAYCAWVTECAQATGEIKSDQILCLPLEYEWERASRQCNPESDYTWGDEWHEDCAHVGKGVLDLNQPVPVGMFPRGSCNGGPMDLAGNVWEWTASLAISSETTPDRSACFRDPFSDVVVRGSSWYNSHELARSGIRQCDSIYNVYFDVGFRLVKTSTKRSI